MFNHGVVDVLTYGDKNLILLVNSINKINVLQQLVERSMMELSVRDLVSDKDIRRGAKVTDAIRRIISLTFS